MELPTTSEITSVSLTIEEKTIDEKASKNHQDIQNFVSYFRSAGNFICEMEKIVNEHSDDQKSPLYYLSTGSQKIIMDSLIQNMDDLLLRMSPYIAVATDVKKVQEWMELEKNLHKNFFYEEIQKTIEENKPLIDNGISEEWENNLLEIKIGKIGDPKKDQQYGRLVKHLKSQQTTSLDLSGTEIDGENGIDFLIEALQECKTLEKINLFNAKIGFIGSNIIIKDVLTKNFSITHLDLSFSDIDILSWIDVINALQKGSKLRILNLSGNKFANGYTFAEALKETYSLETLMLRKVGFNTSTIQTLCNALSENSSLKTLDLGENPKSGEVGSFHIADLIFSNTSLKNLILDDCGITIRGIKEIYLGLNENSTLTNLVLRNNPYLESIEYEDVTVDRILMEEKRKIITF